MKPYYQDESVTIYHEDCRDVLPQLAETVDLVLTDPPYPREFDYTYDYLADYCPPIMRRGASLLCIVGHYAIPVVLAKFDGKLKYRWVFCMNQFDGTHARMAMGIEVMWKPMLWFVKDAYPQGRGFIRDGFCITGREGQHKDLHKWQQDTSWAHFPIEKLSQIGDIVLDPLMGSGTAVQVAKTLGRRSIGVDVDEQCCEVAANRAAQTAPFSAFR